jgi:4-amino-4-deoxy-L-arabinose transferase-like glycosyltransferase
VPSHREPSELDRTDYVLALAVGVAALAAYVRTLAPDVLYSDSAEFQTLAYTLGMTHSTGYPVYLLLARMLGLLPLGSMAWRVNLLSALSAAVTLSAVYLLARHVTRSRTGALLGSLALGLSYTFWSQAIIAEVYTPGLAFLSMIVLLLWRWQRSQINEGNNWGLLVAALLAGLSLGVHASVTLIAPAAVIFVVWTLWSRRCSWSQWRRSLLAGCVGLVLGVSIFVLTFLALDLNNPPSSFYQVALQPSRSTWGLQATDLDSPIERMWATVTGVQWQDAMFPGGDDFISEALATYVDRLLAHEFTLGMLLCAVLGLMVMERTTLKLFGFTLLALGTMLYFILHYEPPDKYIFYLPTYIFVALAIGAGAGILLEMTVRNRLARRGRWRWVLQLPVLVVLLMIVVKPYAPARWRALQAGTATFVHEEYVYPLYNLDEPRQTASWQLTNLPEDAVLIVRWRALYTMYYLAHVEGKRPDILIMEASPHGAGGGLADSLIQQLQETLRKGRPVFADQVYRNMRAHFRVQPALGGNWYRLSLTETSSIERKAQGHTCRLRGQ